MMDILRTKEIIHRTTPGIPPRELKNVISTSSPPGVGFGSEIKM